MAFDHWTRLRGIPAEGLSGEAREVWDEALGQRRM
jgi:hypothetical protein